MAVNTITITGFKEYAAKLRRLGREFPNQLDDIAGKAAGTWEQGAKRAVPVDQGTLKRRLKSERVINGQWQVTSPTQYSPYMEWGTKSRANVPAELQNYAAQFKGKGVGESVKELIYAWVLRKGLPKQAQWPIFISIMRTGVRPHPFFFIQRPVAEKQLLGDLKQLIDTLE